MKRFRLLRLMLQFCGMFVCLSHVCIVLKRQNIRATWNFNILKRNHYVHHEHQRGEQQQQQRLTFVVLDARVMSCIECSETETEQIAFIWTVAKQERAIPISSQLLLSFLPADSAPIPAALHRHTHVKLTLLHDQMNVIRTHDSVSIPIGCQPACK